MNFISTPLFELAETTDADLADREAATKSQPPWPRSTLPSPFPSNFARKKTKKGNVTFLIYWEPFSRMICSLTSKNPRTENNEGTPTHFSRTKKKFLKTPFSHLHGAHTGLGQWRKCTHMRTIRQLCTSRMEKGGGRPANASRLRGSTYSIPSVSFPSHRVPLLPSLKLLLLCAVCGGAITAGPWE